VAIAGVVAVVLAASQARDQAPQVSHASAPVIASPAPVVIRNDPAVLAETQRLVEAVRSLSDDRDRLIARLDQMERALGDVTAAIPRDRNAGTGLAAMPQATASTQQLLSPLSVLPAVDQVRSAAAPATVAAASPPPAGADAGRTAEPEAVRPMQLGEVARDGGKVAKPAPIANIAVPQPRPRAESPTESVGTRTDFAIDIGGDASMEGLRSLWATIRSNNSQLLDGLRPLVSMRENHHGVMELRLIVGPLSNASSAARLCAALGTTGISCQPTQFDGQRLALH
jgi:hypothetical protein